MSAHLGPPECDPSKTLLERLRIAAERGVYVRAGDSAALMAEAADEFEVYAETVDILSDTETMRALDEAMADDVPGPHPSAIRPLRVDSEGVPW